MKYNITDEEIDVIKYKKVDLEAAKLYGYPCNQGEIGLQQCLNGGTCVQVVVPPYTRSFFCICTEQFEGITCQNSRLRKKFKESEKDTTTRCPDLEGLRPLISLRLPVVPLTINESRSSYVERKKKIKIFHKSFSFSSFKENCSLPCLNNSTCRSLFISNETFYSCRCKKGYRGLRCEQEKNGVPLAPLNTFLFVILLVVLTLIILIFVKLFRKMLHQIYEEVKRLEAKQTVSLVMEKKKEQNSPFFQLEKKKSTSENEKNLVSFFIPSKEKRKNLLKKEKRKDKNYCFHGTNQNSNQPNRCHLNNTGVSNINISNNKQRNFKMNQSKNINYIKIFDKKNLFFSRKRKIN